MIPYKNLGGNSSVVSYEIGDDYIKVKFSSWACTLYTYTYSSAWSSAVETMKQLAKRGEGLNSYISTYRPDYSDKC